MENSLASKIADKNVDIDGFVEAVLDDENARTEVIELLLNNKDIMVYYHCYYIISKASEKKPELFYKYWDDFAELLENKNSYHRDIGLTIIANLTKADEKSLFLDIFDRYMKHFNDDKFMTAQCFVRNLKKVLKSKNEHAGKIVEVLLEMDKRCTYPEKQKELLKSDIIEAFDEAYENILDKDKVIGFVRLQSNSISPKTRKRAKEFLEKYGLG